MSGTEYAMQEALCEFAQSIQSLIDKGWRIVEIKYGERKFDISTKLVIQKDRERRVISTDEIEGFING